MPSFKELRERAGKVHEDMCQIRDGYHERKTAGKTGAELWPDETRAAWEKANKDYDQLRVQIDEAKRSADLDAAIADLQERSRETTASGTAEPVSRATVPGQSDFQPDHFPGNNPALTADEQRKLPASEVEARDLAIQAWAGYRSPACRSEAHRLAARRYGVDPGADQLILDMYDTRDVLRLQHEFRRLSPALREQRALSSQLGSTGGFLIGSTLVNSLETNMLAYGAVEQLAETIVTQTGEDMAWPTADDTSNEGEIIGENPTSVNEASPSMAQVKWYAYEFSSKLIKVPVRLLEDAPSFLAATLGTMLGERIGRAKNRKFTTGTGNSQPTGIVTAATLGKTTAAATAITFDELIELEHSVDPAYRNDPSCAYMMHDNVVLAVRLLKDGGSCYIWTSGATEGVPDRLNGRLVSINQHMDSAVAASNKTMLFGKFSAYKVRRVRQLVLLRLKERYAELRQEAFIAFLRADGHLLDAGTAPVKYLQQKNP